MEIKVASEKLFNELKHFDNFVGTGVVVKMEKEVIISVYIANEKFKKQIPETYEGLKLS